MTEKWAFTFGYNHKHPKKYVVIEGNYLDARRKMIERFGSSWAFQYLWQNFQEIIEEYNLTELEI